MTVTWSGQLAGDRDDQFDLVDDYDPELNLLDDLCDWED